MRLEFHPKFHLDVAAAADYYDLNGGLGLGSEFAKEVWGAVQRLKENPLYWPAAYRDVRRIRLKRFSEYSVRYRFIQSASCIRVLGVFHAKRHPKRGTRRQ